MPKETADAPLGLDMTLGFWLSMLLLWCEDTTLTWSMGFIIMLCGSMTSLEAAKMRASSMDSASSRFCLRFWISRR